MLREISRTDISLHFSGTNTVPLVFHSDERSTKAVIVFIFTASFVKVPLVRTTCGLALALLAVLLTGVVQWGKRMSPSVVSLTTLLRLMKSKPTTGPVIFFITTKCSAKVWSLKSNLNVVVASNFSNWPFATWVRGLAAPSYLKTLAGPYCLIFFNWFWAIALTQTLGSAKASIVEPLSISRGEIQRFFPF